jgi:hypothetical protein
MRNNVCDFEVGQLVLAGRHLGSFHVVYRYGRKYLTLKLNRGFIFKVALPHDGEDAADGVGAFEADHEVFAGALVHLQHCRRGPHRLQQQVQTRSDADSSTLLLKGGIMLSAESAFCFWQYGNNIKMC